MRRAWAFGAAATAVAVLAGAAASAPASDIYIWGKVLGRVAGKNASIVDVTWAYKCLGDKLGYATYEWTLKLTRQQPQPQTTITLGSGTSKRGSKTVQLTPGQYLPFSDPYRCETERGAGYDKPEIGAIFTVPDYCAWSVSSTRGLVQLEHGSAVKAAKPGATLAPGDALVTPKGGLAVLASNAREGKAELGGDSRLELDAKQCGARGGWLLSLASGQLTASVQPSASKKAAYRSITPNATVIGAPGARWRVEYAKRVTKVRALGGLVRVAKKGGTPSTLKAGQQTTVAR